MAKKTSQSWFVVDREGLRRLMHGKPKTWIPRELVSNSFDEPVKRVVADIAWRAGTTRIQVTDDSPEGFKRLSDAFTMFADTEKRSNPNQRGRFNSGEKLVLSMADRAEIVTTKGTIVFDSTGRHEREERWPVGSVVTLSVKTTKGEAEEMVEFLKTFIVPAGVEFLVNGEAVEPRSLDYAIYTEALPTQLVVDGIFRATKRNAAIHLYKAEGQARLYELGIPVQDIDGPYHVDVRQKVPLGQDRDMVSDSFLARIYVEVLNAVHPELQSDCISEPWIRIAMAHKLAAPDAVKSVVKGRYGNKVAVVGPGEDRRSIDDAIAGGYTIVRGPQMSGGEWENVRKAHAIPSAGSLFPHSSVAGEDAEVTSFMIRTATLVNRIAQLCLGKRVRVAFRKWPGVQAQYGGGTLTFNVSALGAAWFRQVDDVGTLGKILDLVIHELGHEFGGHVDRTYLDAITRMAGQLTVKALTDPVFFRVAPVAAVSAAAEMEAQR